MEARYLHRGSDTPLLRACIQIPSLFRIAGEAIAQYGFTIDTNSAAIMLATPILNFNEVQANKDLIVIDGASRLCYRSLLEAQV